MSNGKIDIYKRMEASVDGEQREVLVPLDVDEDFENRTKNAVQWLRNNYLQGEHGEPGDRLVIARTTREVQAQVEQRFSLYRLDE